MAKSLTELKPGSLKLEDLVASLKNPSVSASKEAGQDLLRKATEFGLSVRDYLTLAVGTEHKDGVSLNGYERTLMALNLPVRNDLTQGISLQAASDTFNTYPGTRAMFPEVIDDVLRWVNRQDQFERVQPMLANSRTVSQTELLSTVVDDDSKERDTYSIAEGSRIPVKSIRTSEKSVKFFKHGSAIRTTYEFSRRASIELLIPYANRINRELELSKVRVATGTLINGDGAYGAAPEVNQSSFNTKVGSNSTNGKISWPHLLAWLVERASLGVPVDTVVMNWDGYFQWLMMFSSQVTSGTVAVRPADNLAAAGANIQRDPVNIALAVRPVLSSATPAGKLIGYSVGDTLEELVESGSQIQETERAILDQTMTMTRTENTGYRIVYGDTRSIFNFGA